MVDTPRTLIFSKEEFLRRVSAVQERGKNGFDILFTVQFFIIIKRKGDKFYETSIYDHLYDGSDGRFFSNFWLCGQEV